MKKGTNINYSLPATFINFTVDPEAENFSRAKLKVFYQGETADHRYFSEKFSNELIKTLPYTPVVCYYDKEKEDFVGHATQQQIVGIVDPMSEVEFTDMEDNNKWCVCDVVLYTERPDFVGEIAQKVVGHKQSLELDPRSVKYVINYDERKHFKNIEFTEGKFIGVSVLGENEKPAFTGSEFFTISDFEKKFQLLKDYCENPSHTKTTQTDGGQHMNLVEFIKLSWGEKAELVYRAIYSEYDTETSCSYPVDMYDDSVIVRVYYITGDSKLLKVNYSINESNEVILGDVQEVHMTYEPVESTGVSVNMTEGVNDQSTTTESNATTDEFTVEEESQPVEESQPLDAANPAETSTEFAQTSTVEDNSNSAEENLSASEDLSGEMRANNENNTTSIEETSSSTTFTESEVQESTSDIDEHTQQQEEEQLAATRAERVELINSYKNELDDEILNQFLSNVDNYQTNESLEIDLLKAYKAEQKQVSPMRAFAFAPTNLQNPQNASENNLDSWVKKNL